MAIFWSVFDHILANRILINFPDVELIKILGLVDNGVSLQTLLVKIESRKFPTESASGCILWSSAMPLSEVTDKDLRKFAFYKPVEPMILWPSSFRVTKVPAHEKKTCAFVSMLG